MKPAAAMSEPVRTIRSGELRLLHLRALLVSGAGTPTAEQQIEWAEASLEAGHAEAARHLLRGAFIRLGLSPQQVRRWNAFAEQVGAARLAGLTAAGGPRRSTMEIALAEWRAFAAAMAPRLGNTDSPRRERVASETMPHQSRLVSRLATDVALGPIEAVNALFGLLAEPRSGGADAVVAAATGPMALDGRYFAGADLATLAPMLTFAGLRDFVIAQRHLIDGPFGSGQLLRHAACFDGAGLGPYFGNVRRLARKSSDLFELAFIADDAARGAGIEGLGLAPWLLFLSSDLPEPLSCELVDDLGDRGDMASLELIYGRAAAMPPERVNVSFIMRLRDAALDHRDHAFAARIQMLIVSLRPDVAVELEVLGSLDILAGRFAAAEQSLVRCVELDPADMHAAARLEALRLRKLDVFWIGEGFGTPEDRRLNRRRARQADAGHTRRREPNPIAVQLR